MLSSTGEVSNYFVWDLGNANDERVKKILNPEKTFANKDVRANLKFGDTIEVSPKSLITMNGFAEIISKVGGGMLAIDYGDYHAFTNSIRGIKNHKFVPYESLLETPGECDLSAYVNFMALAQSVKQFDLVTTSDMVTQGMF